MSSSSNYHNQFNQIQESLHKRLQRVSQLPKDSSSKKPQSDNKGNDFCSEETCIRIAENETLANNIRELRDETGRLRKFVSEKEYEVKQLNKKIAKLEEDKLILAGDDAPAAAPTKIIELSKKNRDLKAMVEGEKSKSIRLQQKVAELEHKVQANGSPKNSRPTLSKEKEESAQEQLQIINIKLIESRNQVQTLKQELKIAHKVLNQEVGEEVVNLSTFLSKDSQGYRGRAMQIHILQNKIKDLERKLKGKEETNVNDKNFTRIKMVEKQRKESMDAVKSELTMTQNDLNEANKKFEGTKSRNRILAAEIKSLKSQVSMLTDKGQHDNELIDTLMRQQEKLQEMMQTVASKQNEAVQKEATTSKALYEHDQQTAAEITQLRAILDEREARLRQLEDEMMSGGEGDKRIRDSIELGHGRLLSSRVEKTKEITSIGINTECTLQDFEPYTRSDGDDGGESEKVKRQQLELKCTQLAAMLKASENEKSKLSQLNSQLSQRELKLNDELCNLTAKSPRSARSPSKLGESKLNTSRRANYDDQLAIQIDENNALKETLRSVQEAHIQDCRVYEDMVNESKQVFLDALKRLMEGNKLR